MKSLSGWPSYQFANPVANRSRSMDIVIYPCIYIYTYIHTYLYIYIYTYISISIHINIHTYKYIAGFLQLILPTIPQIKIKNPACRKGQVQVPRVPRTSRTQDWGCESSQLLRAEEDEQPKVAVRRLVLEPWNFNGDCFSLHRWGFSDGFWSCLMCLIRSWTCEYMMFVEFCWCGFMMGESWSYQEWLHGNPLGACWNLKRS